MFDVGQSYTRFEVAEFIGYPEEKRSGGTWMTGSTEYNGAFYIFTNIGLAGRTGHDYPNRWSGKDLILSGKTNSHIKQPQVKRMISGSYPVHIFWRGADRASFSYAGEASAAEIVDANPVEITWTFEPNQAAPRIADALASGEKGSRRGPPPSQGRRAFQIEDKPTTLYLMVLFGAALANHPLRTDGKEFVKIGISTSLQRRVRELNFGFPPGLNMCWDVVEAVEFRTGKAAFEEEGRLLEMLRRNDERLGGEFALVEIDSLTNIFRVLKADHYRGDSATDT